MKIIGTWLILWIGLSISFSTIGLGFSILDPRGMLTIDEFFIILKSSLIVFFGASLPILVIISIVKINDR